jgi:hypothetical protein
MSFTQQILTEACYLSLLNLFEVSLNEKELEVAQECPTPELLSKGVGLLVVLLSPLLKLPLLFAVADQTHGHLTASTLPVSMFLLELTSQLVSLGFNRRFNVTFTAHGELYSLIPQNLLILYDQY